MTPQEVLDSNPCVDCLSNEDKQTIITFAALQWLSWLQDHGDDTPVTPVTPQEALDEAACSICLPESQMLTIMAVAALAKLQWLEDNP